MTPFYKRNGIVIYCGESSKILQKLGNFDLGFTDPPYGIDGSSGAINKARAKGKYTNDFDDTPLYVSSVVVPIIEQLIAKCTGVIVTPGNKNFMAYPQPVSFGSFFQPASSGMQTFGNSDSQPIFYYGKNPTKKNLGTPCSYQLTETPQKSIHPCPKPINIWTKLLVNFTIEGQSVIDPFMGSGTTLKAAQNTGRKATGIELSEDYCKEAVDNLSQYTFFSIPDNPKASPEQAALW